MTARQRLLGLALTALALFAAWVADPASGRPSVGELSTERPASSPSPTDFPVADPRIAIAYDPDGLGGAGFNQLAGAGVKRAADALGAELQEITLDPGNTAADREGLLRQLAAAAYYPIFAVGSTYAGPLAKVAPEYPGLWFGIVDDGTVDGPNVIGIQFSEEQGAFLVGAAAALTTKTGNVGFVGVVEAPLQQKLEAGFTAGARAANPDVTVQVAYLQRPSDIAGSSDPAAAREAALGMYDAGADVIFAAAGDLGHGVIQAAHERGAWAIGVDTDQYLTSDPTVRGAVLTSMLKRADVGAYTVAMEIARGVPKDGNNVFGLDRGGVGYSTSGGFVDPIRAQLDDFAAQIAAGKIVVPTRP